MIVGRALAFALVAGFLADLLASTDANVEAGIDAYEAGDHDMALAEFDAAIERLGERPELAFDRGLALLGKGDTEGARTAFQRASEAETSDVRASALYELGNLELDAEAYDAAIEHYIECLKARPEHASAKWNLELALKRKQEKEEEEQQDESSSSEDSGGSEESGGEDSGGSEAGETGNGEESGGEESGKQDDSGGQDEPQEEEPEQPQAEQPQEPEPKPVEKVDLQRALEQLDEQDQFLHAQPRGRLAEPAKDW